MRQDDDGLAPLKAEAGFYLMKRMFSTWSFT